MNICLSLRKIKWVKEYGYLFLFLLFPATYNSHPVWQNLSIKDLAM
jgi:hypothetical protein